LLPPCCLTKNMNLITALGLICDKIPEKTNLRRKGLSGLMVSEAHPRIDPLIKSEPSLPNHVPKAPPVNIALGTKYHGSFIPNSLEQLPSPSHHSPSESRWAGQVLHPLRVSLSQKQGTGQLDPL
jgi:hypothetical protein